MTEIPPPTSPPPLPSAALPYAMPEPRSRRIVSMTALITAYALILPVIIVAFTLAPKFEAVFRDFSLRLPLITRLFLATSRWVMEGGFVILLALPLLPAFLLPLLSPRPASLEGRLVRWGVLLAVLLLGYALIILVTTVALATPMLQLMSSVSTS